MARTVLTAESRPARYFWQLRRFPMLEPQEEYTLAQSWCEYGDRNAAHRLVTSHLRLVIKIAKGYRGYGLPISDVISEGNVGLMQALERFKPEKGFRLATYAAWWIRAAIQEYILRSWSLVKIGTATNQRKLFFNLRKAKRRISVLDEGDMRPDQVELLAKRLGVTEHNVIDMNRRLGGDASLNAPIREDGDAGERQDWLVDDSPSQERILVKNEELENRRQGREQILKVHVRKVPLAPDVNLKTIARRYAGLLRRRSDELVSRKSARLVTVSLPRSAAMRPTSDIRRHRHHG